MIFLGILGCLVLGAIAVVDVFFMIATIVSGVGAGVTIGVIAVGLVMLAALITGIYYIMDE